MMQDSAALLEAYHTERHEDTDYAPIGQDEFCLVITEVAEYL